MPWDSLAKVLGAKPHVLAGPVLRKVTPTSVTVWLALQHADTVTVRVLDPNNTEVMRGSADTVAVGQNLHIVAVTAVPTSGALTEAVIYRYNLNFTFQNLSLGLATHGALLAYPAFTMPSFCLPPRDVNSLRLLHGSCRIPHGNGQDALKLADDLIGQASTNALARPHQLLLMGDQIYADDVAASMIVMLTDAADVLLGPNWQEKLPFDQSRGGPAPASSAPPYLRRYMVKGTTFIVPVPGQDSGLTSEDLDGHLLSLGEYLCMYLFVWSDALWPGNADGSQTLPTPADIAAKLSAAQPGRAQQWQRLITTFKKQDIEDDISDLTEFRNALSYVRRALANIPSYMMLDDHEVTDDWNMTRSIARTMYSSPLSTKIVQNALVAYALCQHWGNVPEQFSNVSPPPPGRRLLQLLHNGTSTSYATNSLTIRSLVGVHSHSITYNPVDYPQYHDPDSLIYDHIVEGPGHRIIFTDTRTWRSFLNGDQTPTLLPEDQLYLQIVTGRDPSGKPPPPDDKVLLVVLTTNAPPVQSIRAATRHNDLVNTFKHFQDLHEAWELPSLAFDRLIVALSERLPLVGTGSDQERRGPIILLSGDVHTSYASRLVYRATARSGDPQQIKQKVTAVIAQLVASSFRKQTENTAHQHLVGYTYGPPVVNVLIPDHVPEQYVGWNLRTGTTQKVGQVTFPPAFTADLEFDKPTTIQVFDSPVQYQYSVQPDYTYRLDYLFATRESMLPPPVDPIPPLPSGPLTPAQRQAAARTYNQATGYYRVYNAGDTAQREMVGVNNLGEITFDWGPGDNKRLNHTLRWWHLAIADLLMFTDYVVSFDPNELPKYRTP
jgi:hypothetical protein